MTTLFPERCLWHRRKTKKKTCNDITLAKIRTTRDLVWWMKCHPQLVLQVVSILLSGYSRIKNNEKKKLNDIIECQDEIKKQLISKMTFDTIIFQEIKKQIQLSSNHQ